MKFNTTTYCLIILGWFSVSLAPALAQSVPELEALEAKKQELRNQIRTKDRQLRDLRRKVANEPVMQPLHQQIEQAKQAYDQKLKEDQAIVETRQKEKEAKKVVDNTYEKELEANPQIQKLETDMSVLWQKIQDIESQQRLAEFKIREAERKLEWDLKLRNLRETAWQADRKRRHVERNDEQLKKLREARDNARRAYQKKIREIPEYTAMKNAETAFDQAYKDHTSLQEAAQAREFAWKAYDEQKKKLKEEDPAIQAEHEQLKQLNDTKNQLLAERRKLQDALKKIKDQVYKESTKVTDAKSTHTQAAYLHQQTVSRRAADERKAIEQAGHLLRQKVEADPRVLELKRQIDDLNRQSRITDHYIQIAKLQKQTKPETGNPQPQPQPQPGSDGP